MSSRKAQIRQTHAAFICQAVAYIANAESKLQLQQLLHEIEQQGWQALAAAVRQIDAGVREAGLLNGLDEEDLTIAEAILQGLQDPGSLPDPHQKADPALAAPGLAGMIHAAASGDVQALTLISQMAEQMSRAGGDMARIAGTIRPMINGERDPKKLGKRMDQRGQQLLENILEELEKLSSGIVS